MECSEDPGGTDQLAVSGRLEKSGLFCPAATDKSIRSSQIRAPLSNDDL